MDVSHNFFEEVSEAIMPITDDNLLNKIQDKMKQKIKCSTCNNLTCEEDFDSYARHEFEHFGYCKECQDKMIRIGIVGSREYQRSQKVKEFIFHSKQELGDKLIIVSGGQKLGADGMAKRFAIELKVKYVEFPPAHYSHNQYCILPRNQYNKKYMVWYFNERNTYIAEYSDKIVCFIPSEWSITQSRGTNDTYTKAKKFEKDVVIIK